MKFNTSIRMDIQDLLIDKSFCQWVHNGCGRDSFWGQFYTENIQHRTIINEARKLIESIGLDTSEHQTLDEIWNLVNKEILD